LNFQLYIFIEKIADNPKLSKIAADVNKWAGEDEEDPKVSSLINFLRLVESRLTFTSFCA
jgi:hypothetical protein